MSTNINIKDTSQCQLLLKIFESQLEGVRNTIITHSDVLGISFEKLFNLINDLQSIEKTPQDLNDQYAIAQQELLSCITALQSNDAITQRIEHLSKGVALMNELLGDKSACNATHAWDNLIKQVHQSYTVQEEREIFDDVVDEVGHKSTSSNPLLTKVS